MADGRDRERETRPQSDLFARRGLSTSLREVADLTAVGILVGDSDGAAGFANKAWMEMTGQPDLAWIGVGWLRVLPLRQLDRERVAIAAALARRETYEVVWHVMHPDGREMSLAVTIRPAVDNGVPFGFVATTIDVTEREATARQLVHRATHDPLTGLLNRTEIHALMSHALNRRQRDPAARVAVLFIDVDALKATNDRLGHDAGDRLLQTLAIRIRGAVRPVDAVARYGGDEFVVLCDAVADRDEAHAIARRIVNVAGTPAKDVAPIRVSIGIAFGDEPGVTPEQLLSASDLAMYQAKKNGGGRVATAAASVDPPPLIRRLVTPDRRRELSEGEPAGSAGSRGQGTSGGEA